jgi:hypothetical protein
MRLFRKLLLAGVASAVVSLGIMGAGTASAHDGHDDWMHDNPCYIEATHSIDPVCWQGVYWGGVARGWVPTNLSNFNNFWDAYYFYNYSPAFLHYYNLGFYNSSFFFNVYGQPYYTVHGVPFYNPMAPNSAVPVYYVNGVPYFYYNSGNVIWNNLPNYWWIK